MFIYDEAIRICQLNGDGYQLAKCVYVFGILKEKASLDEGLKYYVDALNILQEEKIKYTGLQSCVLFNIGRVHYKRQNHKVAKMYLQNSIETGHYSVDSYNETIAKSFYFLAKAEFYLKELDSSLISFKSALQHFLKIYGRNSNLVLGSLIGIAKIHACRQEDEQAISRLSESSLLRKDLEISDEDMKDIHESYGELYMQFGNLDKAMEHFKEALELECTKDELHRIHMMMSTCSCKRGNFSLAKHHAYQSIQLYTDSKNENNKEYGLFLEKLGDIESYANDESKAIEYYKKALLLRQKEKENPTHLFLAIGACYLNAGNLQESCNTFQQLFESNSHLNGDYRAQIQNGLAYSLFLLCDYENALKMYIDLDLDSLSVPEIVSAHQSMGSIYAKKGEEQQSCFHYMQAILTFENSFPNQYNSDSPDERMIKCALVAYMEMISIHEKEDECKSKVASLSYGYANALVQRGDFKKASDYYKRVVVLQESIDDSELSLSAILHNLGNCNTILGNLNGSITAFERSLHITMKLHGSNAVESSDTMMSLALAYAANCNFVEAISLGQKALNLKSRSLKVDDKTVSILLRNLGYILLLSGDYDASLKALVEAKKIQCRYFCTGDDNLNLTNYYIAEACFSRGQFEKALRHFKQVNIRCDNYCNVALKIGEIYTTRGEIDMAREFHMKCFEFVEEKIGISFGSNIFSNGSEENLNNKSPNNVNSNVVFKQSINTEAEKCQQVSQFLKLLNVYGVLFKIAEMYEKALICFDCCLEILFAGSNQAFQAGDILYEKGFCLSKLGRLSDASESLNKALEIFKTMLEVAHNERLSKTLKLFGECESKQGRIDNALDLLQQWEIKSKGQKYLKLDNFETQAMLIQVGKLYQQNKDYNSALNKYAASFKMTKRTEMSGLRGESVHALGQLHFENGSYLSAMSSYQHAFDVFREEKNDQSLSPTFSMVSFFSHTLSIFLDIVYPPTIRFSFFHFLGPSLFESR